MPLFYEDFEVGREFRSSSAPVPSAALHAFAELSGDTNPIHFDPSAAEAAGFRGPVAHGVLGLALATGLASRMELTRGTLVALVGITWRFSAPIYPGDELTLVLRVASRRTTTRPGTGLVTMSARLSNQRGDVVQEGEWVELVKRKGTHGHQSSAQ